MQERIRQIRKSLRLTQTQFGERIGVKGNTVTGYETGLRTPSDAVIRSICREFNVNLIWLTQGIGEMFEESDDAALDLIDRVMSGESEFAKTLFKAFAKFDKRDWDDLERLVGKLMETKKEADH